VTASPGLNGQPRPLQASDLPRLSRFLRETFRAPPQVTFAAVETLSWKYLRSDPYWGGGLSYVLERNGTLAAHAGVCPAVFRGPHGERVRCGTIIDWAADRATPGAGLVVHHELLRLADVMFLIGGTRTTWAITSRIGFQRRLEARVYARWVRPFREFRLRRKSLRAALRLMHAVAHPPTTRLASTGGWAIAPVSQFDAAVQPVLASTAGGHGVAERTVAQLNHRLACPAIPTRGYLLRRLGKTDGYAIAAVGSWETKILDIRLSSNDPEDWAAAYALLTDTLRQEPSVCRISALASVPLLQRALESNGYWMSRVEPVSFYDPRRLMEALLPVDVQFFESDLGYYDS
jgi:hypothetical protein